MKPLHRIVAALRETGQLITAPDEDPDLTAVTDDSRRVTPGCLFCAIEGTRQDGHRYVADAAARGAAAAIVVRRSDAVIPQVIVRDSRTAAIVAAAEWFGYPAGHLEIVGVTGTNGKTTTVVLLRHLLNASADVGSIGTLGAFDGAGDPLPGHGNLTTPGAVELHGALAELSARGVRTVIMEASSHALDQRRLESLLLRGAVYTNLTQDHLDYHPTLEAYRDTKAKLSELLGSDGREVVNADDPAWQALPRRPGVRRVTYGRTSGDVQAREVVLQAGGSSATLVFGGIPCELTLPLLGDFNVTNALAAGATAWALGMDPEAIAGALARAPQVPGRLERLVSGEFVILRDYCHTPDALERALEALRPITPGRLIVVFGAGGDRDRGKRPLMGRAVAERADVAVVTSDNPRTEDPDRIVDEIEMGMKGRDHVRITDRRDAIRHAIGMLVRGDCLLLAGKGHETYQEVGTERHPFDERDVVNELLSERGTA
jgi:UDP-N-acetylmuramoyl-L-alanyl-D-glutamate--2,6-diaminopimelate ligase